MEKVYEELIKMIASRHTEVGNWQKRRIPTIYYIGMQKCASTALKFGFPDHSVAHWHCREHFERIYKTKLLSKYNIDLYDIILYIGNKFKFKPLIIECIREPVAVTLSLAVQHLKLFRPGCRCGLCHWKKHNRRLDENFIKTVKKTINVNDWYSWIQSIPNWKKFFNKNVIDIFNKKTRNIYCELEKVKLLFFRFEEVGLRPELFKIINYRYRENNLNTTENDKSVAHVYQYIKDKITFTEEELDIIYSDYRVRNFYNEKECTIFKDKFLRRKTEISLPVIETKEIEEVNEIPTDIPVDIPVEFQDDDINTFQPDYNIDNSQNENGEDVFLQNIKEKLSDKIKEKAEYLEDEFINTMVEHIMLIVKQENISIIPDNTIQDNIQENENENSNEMNQESINECVENGIIENKDESNYKENLNETNLETLNENVENNDDDFIENNLINDFLDELIDDGILDNEIIEKIEAL